MTSRTFSIVFLCSPNGINSIQGLNLCMKWLSLKIDYFEE